MICSLIYGYYQSNYETDFAFSTTANTRAEWSILIVYIIFIKIIGNGMIVNYLDDYSFYFLFHTWWWKIRIK